MKKQLTIAGRIVLSIIFSAAFLVLVACTGKKEETQTALAFQSTNKPPKINIHTAIMTNNMEALKQHIAAKSDLNEKDPVGGSSPLISASLFGRTEMAKMLIDAGADLNFRNNDGSTALHTAAFFCRPGIVTMLLQKGADKTVKNKYGSTAYESVVGPYADVKGFYESIGKMLEPMGLKLDYDYIQKTRPVIANMLK